MAIGEYCRQDITYPIRKIKGYTEDGKVILSDDTIAKGNIYMSGYSVADVVRQGDYLGIKGASGLWKVQFVVHEQDKLNCISYTEEGKAVQRDILASAVEFVIPAPCWYALKEEYAV